jgi:glycosyltransferase involved in cell wall biosynthesis
MLDGLGCDRRHAPPGAPPAEIECYHVNCRYSDTLEDIGSFRLEKMWLVLRYCLEAIWCRFRFGARSFYYVPAPGKRAALYRDWVVMLLCRPFFRDFIHHWHAVGLGDWLRSEGTWFERWFTRRLLGRGSLGIALAIPSMRDALWFRSRQVEIVPNGIPDPCPDFETSILPRRRARLLARRRSLDGIALTAEQREAAGGNAGVFSVLFLAHCMRAKGLFDALEAVALANARLKSSGHTLSLRLTVAGAFAEPEEEVEFRARVAQPDLAGCVEYVGFVGDEQKRVLLAAHDALCFPSYYHAESFGLVVIEAMAAGLAIVTTRWRALPDLLPPDYPGAVALRDPEAIARALIAALDRDDTVLQAEFISRFTAAAHLAELHKVLAAVDRLKSHAN